MTAVGLFKELFLFQGCRLGDSRDRLLLNDVMFMFWGHTGLVTAKYSVWFGGVFKVT